ncbi:hypothetical protein G7Y89_g10676 [Cudoniella acicularis]|uniref:Major facilitator superfamily (MFS) profile domain-containing protein n=1 Tax=Cudoniella acicularis TaxID=354080 RepID=A0A8H4VYS6_9HELO|nr:hypothetical protein G7Y89_g10676 [Cudoniella acicularis]
MTSTMATTPHPTAAKPSSDDLTEKPTTDTVEASEASTPVHKQLAESRRVLVVCSLCMVVFIAALDTVAMTVALPSIVQNLEASDSAYSWIASAYLLAQCVTAPIWGKFSDVFGRKPVLLVANALFFAASLIAALSVNTAMLLVARTAQGVGAGGLLVLANICISDLFSLRERAKYLGLLGAVWAVAVALAPLIGGALTERLSWRWIFWINLPCIALSILLLATFLRVHNQGTTLLAGLKAIDWLGTVLVIAGTTILLVGLQFGGVTYPWSSATVICLLLFGILTLLAFGFVQWRVSTSPLIPSVIFTQRSNIAVLIVCFCQSLAFMASAFFLPLYFQLVLGASSLLSGVWFLPLALTFSVFCVATGVFIRRTGHYLAVIRVGLLAMTLGCGLFVTFPSHADWPRIICFQGVAAIGIGLNFYAPLLALQAHLEPPKIAAGTSAFQFVRMLSNAISLVIGQVIVQSQVQAQSAGLLVADVPPSLMAQLGKGNIIEAVASIRELSPGQQEKLLNILTFGFSRMWIFYSVVSFVGLMASLSITNVRTQSTQVGVKSEEDNIEMGQQAGVEVGSKS